MLRIDRRLLSNMDWLMAGTVVLLSAAGITTIFSATRPLFGGSQPDYYVKQIYWLLIGLGALTVIVSINYTWFHRVAYHLYGGGLAILVIVLIMGRVGGGAQRWLSLGPFNVQPSEFFKIAYLMALARFLSADTEVLDGRRLAQGFGLLVLPPLLLVLVQPDLGTSMVLLLLFVGLALAKGVQKRLAIILTLILLVSVPFLGTIAWDNLKDYQKDRIISFVRPGADAGGLGYHVEQSKVAVGSGGLYGKGYLKGTQGPFRFLPEKHTDFVFAVFAEERGFFGSMILLSLYLTLLMRGLGAARLAKDDFARYLCLGIVYLFAIHLFVNMGMTMGLAPVVGLPLPFMSYGGSSMLTNSMAVGVLMGVRARRFELFF